MKMVQIFAALLCIMVWLVNCGRQKAKSTKSQPNTLATTHSSSTTPTAEQVLAELKSGNENFAKEVSSRNYNHGKSYNYFDQVAHTKNDQHPKAFILSCMDSRVPPEIIFDQGIGELFVDRIAGNVEDLYILGSMEYAVNVKGVKLIVVMGHKNCGAINAVFGHVDPSNEELIPLIAHIKEGSIPNDPPPYDASAKHNVVRTIDHILKNSKSIRSKVEAHELIIAGALYDVTNGTIDWDTRNW
jgi:carbonic anhydrase